MSFPDYEAAMKAYWLAYEFDNLDDETAVKNAVDAALGDTVLYNKHDNDACQCGMHVEDFIQVWPPKETP